MTEARVRRTTLQSGQESGSQPSAGENARRQLVAALPVTERRISAAGIWTALLAGGDGPPVVLLHGPMANATHWMGIIPGLVKDHRVIVPDLPGHGCSKMPDSGAIDIDRMIEWLDSVITQSCRTAPAVIGQLLGGAIAIHFAHRLGDRLSKLVLVDTFGLCPFQPAPEFGAALSSYLAQPDARAHTQLWQQCAFDLDSLRRRMGERWPPFEAYNLDRARAPDVQAAVAMLMETFGAPAIPPADLARIAVPTSLIWGRHDRATPLAIAEQASARYGWPLHVIESCNDDPPVEQPDALLRALRVALAGG